MKTLLAIVALAFVASAAQATPLLKARRSSSFSPVPFSKTLLVDSSGDITLTTEEGNKSKTEKVGSLAVGPMKRIKDQLKDIADNAKLIDEQEGQPMCYDIPATSVSVFSAGNEIEISRKSGCHKFSLESGYGTGLADLGYSLLDL